MASTQEVNTRVIDKLAVLYKPNVPRTLDGKPNEAYVLLVQIYIEALKPFTVWELEAGMKALAESYKYSSRWPTAAEIRGYCFDQMPRKPKARQFDPYGTEPSVEYSEEHRHNMADKYARLKQTWKWPPLPEPERIAWCYAGEFPLSLREVVE